MRRVALVALVVAGCFDPQFSNNPTCGGASSQDCPAGTACSAQGICVQVGCGDLVDGDSCVATHIADGVCLGAVCVPRGCGDGLVGSDEVCDDGNRTSGDGCSADCQSNETCGNGYLDPKTEQCDPAITGDAALCRAAGGPHACTVPTCGDGIIDAQNGELCDNGSAANTTTPSAPGAACRPDCQPSRCGDHIVDPGEVCDDGNTVSGDGCAGDCRSNETCGNGRVDAIEGEECDSGPFGLSADGCSSLCTIEDGDWVDTSPAGTSTLGGDAMAYDSHRHRMVLFGGGNQTFEFDGVNWLRRDTLHRPPSRFLHAMTFDSKRNRIVMVGGASLPDTWEFDGIDWIERQPPHSPQALRGAGLAFDSDRGRVVLFGGLGSDDLQHAETWVFDGNDWTQVVTAHAPSPRSTMTVAYDSARHVVVLFGGGEDLNDTWEFDGVDWTQKLTTFTPPSRFEAGMAFDSIAQRVVLFGGDAGHSFLNDTWTFDGTNWLPVGGPAPTGRQLFAMAYDSDRHRTTIIGGFGFSNADNTFEELDETWTFDASSWTQLAIRTSPRIQSAAAVYDEQRGRVVLFGGLDLTPNAGVTADTWELDGVNWILRDLASSPSARMFHAMVYETAARRTLLFGGSADAATPPAFPLGDTWEFDGNTWAQITTSDAPSARSAHAMAYDTTRSRAVLFGGTDASGTVFADTWEFDGAEWESKAPAHSPSPRFGASMAYDPVHHRTVLFGGRLANDILADTWAFDGVDWTELATPVAPPGRVRATMSYDPDRGVVVLFGGSAFDSTGSFEAFADTWELDDRGWHRRSTATVPPPRDQITSAYDGVARALIMFGGGDARTFGLRFLSAAVPPDSCIAGTDSDGDGLVACADPDCWATCTPFCPPTGPCDPASRCGDGVCNAFLEDYIHCPADCPAP